MSLSDLIADDVAAVFLNTDEFAETVTVFESDGAYREIVAVVGRKTKQIDDERNVKRQPESIQVFCRKHAEAGILAPAIGLAVRLAGEAESSRWTFAEILDEDAASLTIRFEKAGYYQFQGRSPTR